MGRALLCALILTGVLSAQDHHYWTHQFGTRAGLRGGAVVGGVDDTSAVYYNPGRLGFVRNNSLKVSADAYQLSTFNMPDGAGKGLDLSSVRGDIVPLAGSGVFLFEGAPGHAVGFSILTRQYSDVRASADRRATINVIDDARSPGAEEYIGNLDLRVDTEEYWAGLCYSWAMADWLSIGISNFGALRYEDLDVRITSRAVNAVPATFGADSLSGLAYWNLRVLAKVGVAVDLGAIKMGMALTTPGAHFAGGATVSREFTLINLDTNGDGQAETLEASARQSAATTRFHSPWSIASGLDWAVDATTLAFTWEWFLPVGKYEAVRPENGDDAFIRGGVTGGPTVRDVLTVYDGRRGCFNLALAAQNRWDEDWTGVWSFRTDYAADYLHDGGFFLGISTWDLFHFATGIEYTTRQKDGSPKHDLAIGLQLTIGSGKGEQPVNFDNPTEAQNLFGKTESKPISYFAIGLIIGYTYYF